MTGASRTIRNRQADTVSAIDCMEGPGVNGDCAVLAMTGTVATYPTSAGVCYAMFHIEVDGDESEGSSASYHQDVTRVFYAYNIGTAVPPHGTLAVCYAVGGRWVFRYDG